MRRAIRRRVQVGQTVLRVYTQSKSMPSKLCSRRNFMALSMKVNLSSGVATSLENLNRGNKCATIMTIDVPSQWH